MDTREQAELRRAVTQAAETQGVREVARQVGMSPMGLRNVTKGVQPHPRTWAKLREWYARERGAHVEMGEDAAPVALEAFLQLIAPTLRVPVREAIVGALGRLYGEAGLPAPAWLTEMPGAVKAYEAGADRRRPPFAVVEVAQGGRVVLESQPEPGEPRAVVEEIARRGVWRENTFYPSQRIVRITCED
ncbi:MAG TPA: hypothetical protein VHG51_16375 [Longimicrobiaceae bacterium]|nr:hypothetical protein [Longimicrobiaceae bacterium]